MLATPAPPTRQSLGIRAYQQQRMRGDNLSAEQLSDLCAAVDQTYARNASRLSFTELYQKAYQLVLRREGGRLYNAVLAALGRHLDATRVRIIDKSGGDTLTLLRAEWARHELVFSNIAGLLMYMDRQYCEQEHLPPIYEAAVALFRSTVVLGGDGALTSVTASLLELVERERRGDGCEQRAHLRESLNLLRAMDRVAPPAEGESARLYYRVFETPLLEATHAFYRTESALALARDSCPDYLRLAERRFAEERARANHCFLPCTASRLAACLEARLLNEQVSTLVNGGGVQMLLQETRLDDLKRMYTLFSRLPRCVDVLRDFVSSFVRASGLAVLEQQAAVAAGGGAAFVSDLLRCKDRLDEINQAAFRGDVTVAKSIRTAFEGIVNGDKRSATFLAAFADELLRAPDAAESSGSGGGGGGENDLDAKLDKLMVLYRYLNDKDIFESLHRGLLCKRLLGAGSGAAALEMENALLSRLKAESGYQFTTKMEGMLNDMRASATCQSEFQRVQTGGAGTVELGVTMLTAGFWPLASGAASASASACILPPVLVERCRAFEEFYLRANARRKLTWLTSMGSADVRAHYPLGVRELSVSTYQCVLLALFSASGTGALSLVELRKGSNIPEPELRRHLLSLCTPKLRLLHKSSKGRGIEDDDVFTVNREFTSPKRRIKVPLVSLKDVGGSVAAGASSAASESEVPAEVQAARKILLDAAIVRTMKARRTLSHNDLIVEVSRQLAARFAPTPMVIKKQIESLIERDYMQRDAEDARMYSYIA